MVIVGGDLNGHIGRKSDGFESIHGGVGYGDRNKDGEKILEFGTVLNLAVCNTWFRKDDERLVTFESGEHKS